MLRKRVIYIVVISFRSSAELSFAHGTTATPKGAVVGVVLNFLPVVQYRVDWR